jgi:hypothetical protein
MSFEPKYKPFRIVKRFEVISTNRKTLIMNCRNASFIKQRGKAFYAVYMPLKVVNVPTELELAFFQKGYAVEIPQIESGVDKPNSGLARSARSARKAHDESMREIIDLKNAMADEAVLIPMPEKEIHTDPIPDYQRKKDYKFTKKEIKPDAEKNPDTSDGGKINNE